MAIVISAIVFAHYVLDSGEVGWGIRWLWPILPYYFCYKLVPPDTTALLHPWSPDEQQAIAAKYGDNSWLKRAHYWRKDIYALIIALVLIVLRLLFSTVSSGSTVSRAVIEYKGGSHVAKVEQLRVSRLL